MNKNTKELTVEDLLQVTGGGFELGETLPADGGAGGGTVDNGDEFLYKKKPHKIEVSKV